MITDEFNIQTDPPNKDETSTTASSSALITTQRKYSLKDKRLYLPQFHKGETAYVFFDIANFSTSLAPSEAKFKAIFQYKKRTGEVE